MAVRMRDIAQELGVSLMTVSKALRNHTDIARETRLRVLQRARELGYQPNLIARSLVSRRTFLVGLIVPDMMHSFFAEVGKGVGSQLEPLGYQIVISNSEERAATELQQIRVLTARRVDGLIIASAAHDAGSLTEALNTRNVRYVLVDRLIPSLEGDYVGVNDEEVGTLAVEHLIEQGCRRIAHIRGPEISTALGRLSGYRRTLAKHGLKVPREYVISGEFDDEAGYKVMQTLLNVVPRPDAVFGYNDPVAAGAIKAILEAGLRVPQDIAVVGAGNVHYSDLLRVPLTTVDQSSFLLGQTAADLLVQSIEAKEPHIPRHILFPTRLVVRESSRRKSVPTLSPVRLPRR